MTRQRREEKKGRTYRRGFRDGRKEEEKKRKDKKKSCRKRRKEKMKKEVTICSGCV